MSIIFDNYIFIEALKLAQRSISGVYFQVFRTSEKLKYEIFSSQQSPVRERTKGATLKHVLSVSNKLIQNRLNIERRTNQLPRSVFLSFLLFLRIEFCVAATEIERFRILPDIIVLRKIRWTESVQASRPK